MPQVLSLLLWALLNSKVVSTEPGSQGRSRTSSRNCFWRQPLLAVRPWAHVHAWAPMRACNFSEQNLDH